MTGSTLNACIKPKRNSTDRAQLANAQQAQAQNVAKVEASRAAARTAAAGTQGAQANIRIAEESVKATQVSRKGLQAQVDMAKIDLANTVIYAPRSGQIGEVSARTGQYVTAGSQLLFLVPESLWVVANFKEGQTWKMHIGQHVSFAVDAFQGEKLTGTIEEIAPATGSEFSVLRPDNASGNFTKVVQRLPVRIAIDPDQALAQRLRPGMSVVVKVNTADDAGNSKSPAQTQTTAGRH